MLHGKSWDVDENADIVISILKELNIEECDIVGWSMGSAVGMSDLKQKTKLDRQISFNNTI